MAEELAGGAGGVTGEWRRLEKLNWRGRLAWAWMHYQAGHAALGVFAAILGSATVLKILFEVPTTWGLVVSVLLTPVFVIGGWYWNHRGIVKQLNEMAFLEGLNTLQLVDLWLQIRTAEALKINVKGMTPHQIAEEIRFVLASTMPERIDQGR